MPPIKTLIFDIGGVLLNIHPEKCFNLWEDVTGWYINQLQEEIFWDIYYQYEIGELDDFNFYSAINNLFPEDKKISEGDFWHGWKLLLGNQTEVVDLLTNPYRTIPVWLLSNTNPWHVRYLKSCSDYCFYKFTTGAIYSHDVGYRKPDENIYKLTLDKIKSSGEKVLFIDDNQENIEGAKNSGMNAVIYEGLEGLIETLEDFEISIAHSKII